MSSFFSSLSSSRSSLSSSGSTFGSSSSSSSSSSGTTLIDESFAKMIQSTEYRVLLDAVVTIEVYLNREGWHWFLLVKMKDTEYKFVTVEITTSDMQNLVRTMRIRESAKGSDFVGDYTGSFKNLCQIADCVVDDMGSYNLFTSNCQHFCNNLLLRIGLKHDFSTTIGPNTTVCKSYTMSPDEDNSSYVAPERLEQIYLKLFAGQGGVVGARLINALLSAPR